MKNNAPYFTLTLKRFRFSAPHSSGEGGPPPGGRGGPRGRVGGGGRALGPPDRLAVRGLEELAREVQALERGGLSLQLLDLTVKEGTVLAWAHFSGGEVLRAGGGGLKRTPRAELSFLFFEGPSGTRRWRADLYQESLVAGKLTLSAAPGVDLEGLDPFFLLPEEEAEGLASSAETLLEALRTVEEGLGKSLTGRVVGRAGEALSELALALKALAPRGPFRVLAWGGELAVWNRKLHFFPGPLERLPEGGPWEGPLPGRPGTRLKGEVVPGKGPRESLLIPEVLWIASSPFKWSARPVPLFASKGLYPKDLLAGFLKDLPPEALEDVDRALRERGAEETLKEIALARLGTT